MALKVLMLKKKLEEVRTSLKTCRSRQQEFEEREKDLERAVDEAKTEEEQKVVEEEIDAFDTDKAGWKKEEKELKEEESRLAGEIERLESENNDLAEQENETTKRSETRMTNRSVFFGKSIEERTAFFHDETVRTFLNGIKERRGNAGSIANIELTVPETVLDIVREQIPKESKLIKHVDVKKISGQARKNIVGTVPEAVWTEMVDSINEIKTDLNDVEVDGYKVAAMMYINTSSLEDSDIALATEVITMLSRSIAIAIDKAILYGKGIKMPLGVVTRLAQTEKPNNETANARGWKDLSGTNIITITGKKAAALFQELLIASGNASSNYSQTGSMFWAMNKSTLLKLKAEALSFNAAGAIVSGQTDTMPIVGGAIETLECMQDGDIVCGYGDNYILGERAGVTIAVSEHYRFKEDQVAYKGTARYDGKPVIPEAFVLMNINGVKPLTTLDFSKPNDPAVAS